MNRKKLLYRSSVCWVVNDGLLVRRPHQQDRYRPDGDRRHPQSTKMARFFVTRHWRFAKLMYGLFVLEFFLTVAALTFFGIADPNTYRTKLWQNGANKGFNSDPSVVLYSFANYRPISTPLVWSQ